jgi:hypothetical protein
LLTLSQLL